MRAFFFQTYHIPSDSMRATLFVGDYVVINKLAYGPRIPITPISLPIAGSKKYIDFQLPYYRIFGYGTIQRNDVIAFNFSLSDDEPIDMREEFVKRCIAIPGDTVQIVGGKVTVNGIPEEAEHLCNNYKVVTVKPIDEDTFEKLDIVEDPESANNNYYLTMTADQMGKLLQVEQVQSVTVEISKKDAYHPSVFPNQSAVAWNIDYFGPLWVPRKGDSIQLNDKSIFLFQRTIERYENVTVLKKDSVVLINGIKKSHYIFKNNYYFVLGDNRHNSIDSRYKGFIPESHIIGKASVIVYSAFKTNRRFLSIN